MLGTNETQPSSEHQLRACPCIRGGRGEPGRGFTSVSRFQVRSVHQVGHDTRGFTAAIASAGGSVVDLSGKRLNNLDLSGLDLSKTKLEGAYINGTNFTGSNLNGVKLNKAWALKANFSNATLKGASLIETEMMDGICDGADFSGARVAANMSRASLLRARFDAADLAAHGRGLLNHGVFTSAKLDGASFKTANLARAVFEFASLREADFAGADLSGSALAGADMTGANVAGADFQRCGCQLYQARSHCEVPTLRP